MAGKWSDRLDRWMPKRDEIAANRYVKPFADRVLRSDLWRFTRRSVPRGVALGILMGFWLPFGQFVAAALLAMPIRANVPTAMVSTLITNPFTYPFWIVAANQVGKTLLRLDALTYGRPINTQVQNEFGEWLSWFMEQAAATAFGFLVLGIVLAALGYLLAAWFWRWRVSRKWAVPRRGLDRLRDASGGPAAAQDQAP